MMKISDDLPIQGDRPVGTKSADQGKVIPLKVNNQRDDQRGQNLGTRHNGKPIDVDRDVIVSAGRPLHVHSFSGVVLSYGQENAVIIA